MQTRALGVLDRLLRIRIARLGENAKSSKYQNVLKQNYQLVQA